MPYVQRDDDGNINGIYANLQPGYAEEYLPDNNPEVLAFMEAQNAPPPVAADANARIDAGIMAALTTAEDIRDSVHAISPNFTPANFQAFLLQAKILSDAFVAMLQAQAAPPPP